MRISSVRSWKSRGHQRCSPDPRLKKGAEGNQWCETVTKTEEAGVTLSGKGSRDRTGSSVHPDFEGESPRIWQCMAQSEWRSPVRGRNLEEAVETPGCWKRQEHGTFAEGSQPQSGASLKKSLLAAIDKTAGVRAPRAPWRGTVGVSAGRAEVWSCFLPLLPCWSS